MVGAVHPVSPRRRLPSFFLPAADFGGCFFASSVAPGVGVAERCPLLASLSFGVVLVEAALLPSGGFRGAFGCCREPAVGSAAVFSFSAAVAPSRGLLGASSSRSVEEEEATEERGVVECPLVAVAVAALMSL